MNLFIFYFSRKIHNLDFQFFGEFVDFFTFPGKYLQSSLQMNVNLVTFFSSSPPVPVLETNHDDEDSSVHAHRKHTETLMIEPLLLLLR